MTAMLSALMVAQDFTAGEAYVGPPPPMMTFSDMGVMRWPISFCLLMVLILAVQAAVRMRSGEPDQQVRARTTIDGGLFWGVYAAVLGVLGTVVGFMVAAQSIEAFGRVEAPLVWGGVKVALSTTVYGLLIFLLASITWFALRHWHRKAVLGGA